MTCDDMLDRIRKALRQVQNMSGCTTKTLNLVLKHLHPFLKGCGGKNAKEMHMGNGLKRQSSLKRQLHGCVCNEHVFGPKCTATHCPKCAHPRYNNKGKPFEVVFFCCL